MSKAPSPLLGYNNNIRYRGRVFHVQTEDSGLNRPHVITHLFMDGGRILNSVKTSYAEHVGSPGVGEIVRKLMKEQHKAMFVALRDGKFDHLVGEDLEDQETVPRVVPVAGKGRAPAMSTAELTRAGPPPLPPGRPSSRPALDVEALERAAAQVESEPFRPMSELPPPPPNLLRPRPSPGQYGSVSPPRAEPSPHRGQSSPPPRSLAPVPPAPPAPQASRYSFSRPEAAYAQSRPRGGSKRFGEEILSERTLDEVILSYLSEDLGEGGDGRDGNR